VSVGPPFRNGLGSSDTDLEIWDFWEVVEDAVREMFKRFWNSPLWVLSLNHTWRSEIDRTGRPFYGLP
jgi:hypothetical protein